MHDFGVTCSYSEVLRFKASAATTAAQDVHSNLRTLTDAKHGLIQAVADNFNANISSQNCLRSTHALALLLTQDNKRGKRKAQGVPQSQTAALPRPQEEEETDKSEQAQTEQTYEKH